MAITPALIIDITSLYLSVLMPIDLAPSSSSRMAIRRSPNSEFLIRQVRPSPPSTIARPM
jgi:hypothetical protein